MKRIGILSVLIWFAILLYGCDSIIKQSLTTPAQAPVAGTFGIIETNLSNPLFSNSLSNQTLLRGQTAPPSNIVFDIGSLRATKTVYFGITNIGINPITDIVYTSSKTFLKLSHANTSELGGVGFGIFVLLGTSFEHGQNAGGVGTAPLLSKGMNEVEVSIVGKTINAEAKQVTVSSKIKIIAMAEVFDFKIYRDGIEIPYDEYGRPIQIPYMVSQNVEIENVGSVPIVLESENFSTFSVNPDIRIQIPRYIDSSQKNRIPTQINITGANTISDRDKFYSRYKQNDDDTLQMFFGMINSFE